VPRAAELLFPPPPSGCTTVVGLPFSITGRATVKLCVLWLKVMGIPSPFAAKADPVVGPAFTPSLNVTGLAIAPAFAATTVR
jgi:hypothetical protein